MESLYGVFFIIISSDGIPEILSHMGRFFLVMRDGDIGVRNINILRSEIRVAKGTVSVAQISTNNTNSVGNM